MNCEKLKEMQQELRTAKKKMSHKKCYVKGCTSKDQRMFSFPSVEKDHKRFGQWVTACGRQDLLHLSPQKLKNKTICATHFEKKYFLYMRLATSAVPTCNLPVPAAGKIESENKDSGMGVTEEEEHQPDCSVESKD